MPKLPLKISTSRQKIEIEESSDPERIYKNLYKNASRQSMSIRESARISGYEPESNNMVSVEDDRYICNPIEPTVSAYFQQTEDSRYSDCRDLDEGGPQTYLGTPIVGIEDITLNFTNESKQYFNRNQAGDFKKDKERIDFDLSGITSHHNQSCDMSKIISMGKNLSPEDAKM